MKGFWDGSSKDNSKSGFGVAIKRVDRSRWVTISEIAVPLKDGTAMAAEVAGVCVLKAKCRPDFQQMLVFRISIGVLTESLTNNDVAIREI